MVNENLIKDVEENPIKDYLQRRKTNYENRFIKAGKYIAGGLLATALTLGAFKADSIRKEGYISEGALDGMFDPVEDAIVESLGSIVSVTNELGSRVITGDDKDSYSNESEENIKNSKE